MRGMWAAGAAIVLLTAGGSLALAAGSWTVGTSPAPSATLAPTATPTPTSGAPVEQLPIPRADHSATLLQDGRVLVVGGYGAPDPDGGYLVDPSALLWDPMTGTFADAGTMADPRSGHAAVGLADGRVLLVGGRSSTVETWDPATSTFTVVAALPDSLWDVKAILLHDGRVLVVPEGSRRDTWIWDPATGVVSRGPERWLKRDGMTVTVLASGRVLIVGGADVRDGSVERWDPGDEAFQPGKRLLEDRWDHTATLLPDGGLLVVGGMRTEGRDLAMWEIVPAMAELRDPLTRSFVPAGTLSHARTDHTATLLGDGRVAVIGGYDGGPDGDGVLAAVELWNPLTRSFGEADPLVRGRTRHTATLLQDGRVLVVGGIRERGARETPIASVEVWTPPASTWCSAAPDQIGGQPVPASAVGDRQEREHFGSWDAP